jgi:DNA repair protein RecO (recombination protein O)
MREFYSRALVLDRNDAGDLDGVVHLFTEDYGKIVAWAKSLKKNTSKLSAHLQPLTFIKVRFIQRLGPRDGWAIVDCMRDDDFLEFKTAQRYDLIPIVDFLNEAVYDFQPDRKLWALLKHFFTKNYPYQQMARATLIIMGLDPDKSRCALCASDRVSAFHKRDHAFLCFGCASKFPSDKVLLIK